MPAWAKGVLVTLVTIAAIEALARTGVIRIANPAALTLIAVVLKTTELQTLAVELEKGRIPTGFSARLNTAVPDLYLVVAGLDPRSTTQTPNANEVANVNSFTASSDTAGSIVATITK